MPTRSPKPEIPSDYLSDSQKKQILNDPEAVKDLLNTDQAKEKIASLVDSEEVTRLIKQRIEQQVGFQTARVPNAYKQYGAIRTGRRSWIVKEV